MRLVLLLTAFLSITGLSQNGYIRVNLIGYKPEALKSALFLSRTETEIVSFTIHDALTDKEFNVFNKVSLITSYGNFTRAYRMDFSDFKQEGAFYISAEGIRSPVFRINNNVFDGSADFLLRYIRQQQCGYNPLLRDSCHIHDGFIIYNDSLEGRDIDVVGGWHDASDYLRYSATSTTSVFQMLLAYKLFPGSFGDIHQWNGDRGKNGIPDLVDAAKWGVDWMNKMYPGGELMFNQIADDRDHRGFKLPSEDTISYGNGLKRPVYFVSGAPQGLYDNKSRANGRASTAAKFSSAYSMAALIMKDFYPEESEVYAAKAIEAFELGLKYPGAMQTAPCRSPYFYEEDNFADDMELAAASLYMYGKEDKFLDYAKKFAEAEPVTPWFGKDTASHYQYYPFINLGHYIAAAYSSGREREYFISLIREGLEIIERKKKNSFFGLGVPFIWCSNNLISSLLIQYKSYRLLTGDNRFLKSETELFDWLFGVNPWGTGMVVGLPGQADTPDDIHSAFTHVYNIKVDGALVDGPVYATIFNKLKGIQVTGGDEYSEVQPGNVVYHDDWGDYSTNEPTLDGTASLIFYLASLEGEKDTQMEIYQGAITRMDKNKSEIYLIFSGHEFAEGGEHILNVLEKENVKASFFFTGDFYRNKSFNPVIKQIKSNGHYLGAHSDKHLLYCSWEKRDSTLVGYDEFLNDLRDNYAELKKYGVEKEDALFYLPPYEWWNDTIAYWTQLAGLKLINFTPGTVTYRDWTFPAEGGQYYTSEEIYNSLFKYEVEKSLNGAILLMHIGADPRRSDKFYLKLERLISELKRKGYTFNRF
ncbi:MAG: glycoside hydrolase family 9 protein [Ignavibacteriaceae bacterium]|nr:glycoside hydrolase family 9 protein [Ignavibacteriaceae bacterium]